MKLLLFASCMVLFGCWTTASSSVDDALQRIQEEIKQLKKSNKAPEKDYNEKIKSLVKNYEEKFAYYDEKISNSVEVPVAFSTGLTGDVVIDDSPVIFDVVDLNIGVGYDEFSGVFRPPVNGVYQLTFYGLVATCDGGPATMKKNNNVLCQGWLRNGVDVDTATCTVIVELTEGDSVRVTGNSGYPADLRGGLQSGFAGFLIYDS